MITRQRFYKLFRELLVSHESFIFMGCEHPKDWPEIEKDFKLKIREFRRLTTELLNAQKQTKT